MKEDLTFFPWTRRRIEEHDEKGGKRDDITKILVTYQGNKSGRGEIVKLTQHVPSSAFFYGRRTACAARRIYIIILALRPRQRSLSIRAFPSSI